MTPLINTLKKYHGSFHPVLPRELQYGAAYYIDLSNTSSEYADISPDDTDALCQRTQQLLQKHHALIAIGRYAEKRTLYQRSELFSYEDRCVHLGIDLMVDPKTPVYAPLDATVHSFQDNSQHGDYGPTIILQHELDNIIFYTLYGHLSRDSLLTLSPNKKIIAGEAFAAIGHSRENGKWPPHLHFQIIADLKGKYGDFPGVINPAQQAEYLQNCPDPQYILDLKQ